MKTALLATAAAAALVFAGCGGDDENQALSYSAFGEAASEICEKGETDGKPISDQLTGKVDTDAPLYEDLVPVLETGIEDLKALEPPAELEGDFTTYTGELDQSLADLKEAQALAEDGDQAGYLAFLKEIGAESSEVGNAAASKMGAPGCIDDTP